MTDDVLAPEHSNEPADVPDPDLQVADEAAPVDAPEAEPGAADVNPVDAETSNEVMAVVGIGASAGGVGALSSFVGSLSAGMGLAYVVVPHLSATQDSHMTELLARAAELPVIEITQGLVVKPDTIYVLPPGNMIEYEAGELKLQRRPAGPGHRHVIDIFLKSLAAALGNRAIAVILSGTLADGRDGIVEVRRQEGYTFAQDVESAEYPEMPRNAIRTGYIDFIMDPRRMGKQLMLLAKHMREFSGPERVDEPLKKRLFRAVVRLTGIDLSQYKDATLDRRLHRRLVATHCADAEAYVIYLNSHEDEAQRLVEEVLIHVTGFFRNPEVFDGVKKLVLPDLIPDRQTEAPVRVWVPGCATGEEAYSYAMLINEEARRSGTKIDLQVFATDISTRAISIARMGVYSEDDVAGVPPELLERYFERSGGSFRVANSIRNQCVFAVQDVTVDPPFSGMDIVSCRNLLIYLQPETQKHVISILHYALKGSGYLVLGDSESISDDSELFRVVDGHLRILARRQGSASRPVRMRGRMRATLPVPAEIPAALPEDALARQAERVVAAELTTAWILVTDQLQIVSQKGAVEQYLRDTPNAVEPSLLGSLRSGSAEVRKMVADCGRLERTVEQRLRFTQDDGSSHDAIVAVHPINTGLGSIVVSFRAPEKGSNMPPPRRSWLAGLIGSDEVPQLQAQLHDAEARIDAVVEDYESALEQLRVANEETLSMNEELQSTNEELQTATEESQSSAEELRTLNDELLGRNEAVHSVNNDMNNILSALEVPLLVLDKRGNIGRFTRGAGKLFGLEARDQGRALRALRNPFEEVDVAAEAARVTMDLQETRHRVVDPEGHHWELRVHPYKSESARVEGTVIVAMPVID